MKYFASVISIMMITISLSGCLQSNVNSIFSDKQSRIDGEFVTYGNGMAVDINLYESFLEIPFDFVFSNVGEDGPEPSIGITSSGCIFFIAMELPMRSCDHGLTWENTRDFTQAPFTSDPYGWVDPVTDRIFNIHMMGKKLLLFCLEPCRTVATYCRQVTYQ